MTDYLEYTKGGDILIAPSLDCKHQYILRCDLCGEFYGNVQLFFSHYLSHYEIESSDDGEQNEHQNTQQTEEFDLKELIEEAEDENDIGEDDDGDCMEDEFSYVGSIIETLDHDEKATTTDQPKMEYDESEEIDMNYSQINSELEVLESVELEHDLESVKPVKEVKEMPTIDIDLNKEFVENFMKSKENVTVLISKYKKEPNLWDFTLPIANRKMDVRIALWSKIALHLKQECNIEIDCSQVAGFIVYLRQKYRQRKKRGEDKSTKNNEILADWIFKQLSFLHDFVENEPIGHLDIHQDLSPQQVIQLLNIFETLPHLWDTDTFEFYCTNKQNDALTQMKAKISEEMDLEVNEEGIKEYINCIRKYFSMEKRRRKMPNKKETNASRYFTHLTFLDKHVGPFECRHCQLTIYNSFALIAHESQHTETVPFKCPKCQKEFSAVPSYVNHIKRHMGDLNHVCKFCDKRFIRDVDLREHMNCHTGEKPFCCETCGASFRQRTAFAMHKRRHIKKYRSFCPTCSKGFYCKESMLRHAEIHSDERNYICPTCGKAFKTRLTLKFHVAIHENGQHLCKHCGKTFKNKINLRQHSRKQHPKNVTDPLKVVDKI